MTDGEPALLDASRRPDQAFHRHAGARPVDFDVRRGRGPCAARRERRRQVDADQDAGGGPPADAGEIRLRGARSIPASETLPIAFIHQDLGLVDWMTVAENVAMRPGYPRRARPDLLAAARAPRAEALARDGRRHRSRRARRRACRPPSARWSRSPGRWRSRPTSWCSTSRRRPAGGRRRAAARRRCARLRERGIGIDLRHAPAGRGVPHRRPGDRAARRPPVVTASRSAETTPAELVDEDRRPVAERCLRQAGAGRGPRPCSRSRDRRGAAVGPGHLQRRAPARCWGWSACAAPATTRSGARIFGACAAIDAGTCRFDGDAARSGGPGDAMRDGIGFVSSRRGEESLAAQPGRAREHVPQSGRRPARGSSARSAPRPSSARRAAVLQALLRAARRSPSGRSPRSPAATSRRWSSPAGWRRSRALLVLEEPTIGVDVGSKAEIYRLLAARARATGWRCC